jgi:integrase
MTPTIFRRYEGGDWYTRFAVRGKRYLWSTKTDDPKVAKLRAKEYRDKIVAGAYHLVSPMKSHAGGATFAELIESYQTLPIPASAGTRATNIRCLRAMLAVSGLGELDRVDRIGSTVATAYQTKRLGVDTRRLSDGLKSAIPGTGGPSHADIVSTNSTIRKARSLFSKRAMAYYPPEFQLPKERIADFMAVPLSRVSQQVRPVPTPEAIAAADKGLPAHPKEYNAYLLAKYAGLRAGEIKTAQWSWLVGDTLMVGGADGVAMTKSRRFRAIPLDPAVVATLRAGKTDDTYIVGKYPMEIVGRSLVPMLKAYGFPLPDPLHSIRRWHASWRYQNQSLAAAQTILGHLSQTTTMEHYARLSVAPAAMPVNPTTAPTPQG